MSRPSYAGTHRSRASGYPRQACFHGKRGLRAQVPPERHVAARQGDAHDARPGTARAAKKILRRAIKSAVRRPRRACRTLRGRTHDAHAAPPPLYAAISSTKRAMRAHDRLQAPPECRTVKPQLFDARSRAIFDRSARRARHPIAADAVAMRAARAVRLLMPLLLFFGAVVYFILRESVRPECSGAIAARQNAAYLPA